MVYFGFFETRSALNQVAYGRLAMAAESC